MGTREGKKIKRDSFFLRSFIFLVQVSQAESESLGHATGENVTNLIFPVMF